jgi:transposase
MAMLNLDFIGSLPPILPIALDIPDVWVLDTQNNVKGEFIITVTSTLNSTPCRCCGRIISDFHGHDDPIILRHLSILGRPTYIRLRPKRYCCPFCSRRAGKKVTTTQKLSWYVPRAPHTKAYDNHVLLQLINQTPRDVSRKEGVGYDAVLGTIKRAIGIKVNWNKLTRLDVVGIDEIALKKGHRNYVVIVSARLRDGQVIVLAVLPNRKKKTLKKFLRRIPTRLRRTIHTVCTDMYQHYLDAVKEVFGTQEQEVMGNQVRIVIDRFHVAKKYREAADKLRRKEVNRLKQKLSKEEFEKLKGTMWPFRKKEAAWSPEEAELMARLFDYSPLLKAAYELREELTTIFEQPLSKEEATVEIEAWQEKVTQSEVTCFDKFLNTLDNHRDEITNYFVNRESSGFVEGFNNKIKVLKRRCYGIFNIDHLFQRLFLDVEGYRLFLPDLEKL